MATIFDVNPNDMIEELARELKGLIKAPEWATFVKTGRHKERPPERDDWWFVRAAAVLRTVEKMGPIGTSKLRTKYGGKKNRGHKTEHTYKGSGSVLRKILQELDQAGLTRQAEVGVHKGRVVTPKGQALLDRAASEVPAHARKEKPLRIEEAKPRPEAPMGRPRPAPAEGKPAAPKAKAPKKDEQPAQ